jgi:N-hydroxyarylamine O-acetyltransferase
LLLRLELAGESWLVDVGFGGQNLVGALRLEADTEHATPLEPYRLVQMDGDWRMQALVRGRWLSLYRFGLRPVPLIDYIVANHYVSTHPDSFFVNHLNVARTTSDSRLGLRNHEFTVRRMGHEPERRTLGSVAEIRRILENEFLIRLPAHPQLDQQLDSLPDNVPV